MSYRFVKLTTFYPEYLKDFYRRRPEILGYSYAEHLSALMSEGFAWADFLTNAFKSLGVDACEIVANAGHLQAAWGREHGVVGSGPVLVLEQLRALQPDVLFVEDPFLYSAEWLAAVRREVRSIRQVVGWCCAPYPPEMLSLFREFDFMVTCTPGFVDKFRDAGLKAHLSIHAFAPEVLPTLSHDSTAHPDVIFIGSLIPGTGFHDSRAELLCLLADNAIELEVYGKLFQPPFWRTLTKRGVKKLADVAVASGVPPAALEKMPGGRKLGAWRQMNFPKRFPRSLVRSMRPPLYGRSMLNALSSAKIGLNSHGEIAGRYAGNMRLFETTGVGTCLVTDWKENMASLFKPDDEVVVFRSNDECLEKIRWLLANPLKREEIGRAGQTRTLRDYTYLRKAEALDSVIRAGFR